MILKIYIYIYNRNITESWNVHRNQRRVKLNLRSDAYDGIISYTPQ